MILINILLICVSTCLVQNVVGKPPEFRILAPPFVCPKDKDSVIDKQDNTIIILQTEPGISVVFNWVVRWQPLVAPSQQLTLALWETVRELELQLNVPPIESYIFIINNAELLPGVTYIFNVTATNYHHNDGGTQKTFQIDYNKGDPKLLIEGQSDMFAIELLGGQLTYADIDFILEAQVTQCYRTHDYYFVWTVTSAQDNVAVSDVKGSRMVIRANTLSPGQSYDVLCQVYNYSNGNFITQNSLPFRVLHRNLSVHFNVNQLVLSMDTPFKLFTDINKLESLDENMTIAWEHTFGGEPIHAYYEADSDGTLYFPSGLFYVGEHIISLTVTVGGQSVSDQAIARVTSPKSLPVIQMHPMSRILNEGSVATFKANISNIVPGCSVTWYFRSQHCLVSLYSSSTDVCDDNVHGTRISEPINLYSLEGNFLSELTDYTNETSWMSVSASMNARAGRVRLVVECHCVKEDNCTSDGEVYADAIFQLNDKPPSKYVTVIPTEGTAMETVFRLSTVSLVDTSRPLRYSFFVALTINDTLLLGTFLEHTAVETLLPYIKGGTIVWVEVCDSLGACSLSRKSNVLLAPGEARTLEALLEYARAHVRRCELMMLRRLATSAIVTYTNADQAEALSKFTTSLLNAVGSIEERCIENNYDEYNEFIYWLKNAGIDTTKLM